MSREPVRPFEIDPSSSDLPLVVEPDPIDDEEGADSEAATRAALEDETRRPSWRGRLLALALVAALGATVIQAVVYIRGLLRDQPILGVPLAILVATFVAAVVGWVLIEWVQVRRLRGRATLREEAARLVHSELHGGAPRLLAELKPALEHGPGVPADIARFEGMTDDAHDDRERLMLFERTVLAPVDRRARAVVLECARDVGLLTALSPLGLLDGILVMWRTTIMLRAISACYGMRLGAAATLRLLRKCLRNAAIAGVADIVGHAAVEHVGAGLATLVSARAGQGLGNALLAARLGIEAMRQTRPLPFVAEEAPRLKHIRQAVFESMIKVERERERERP